MPAGVTQTQSSADRSDADRSGADQSGAEGESSPEREETPPERLDRNMEELTGELRVVVTGVQVLFAFLLVVPFDTGFASVGSFERGVYFVTLILAALAAACTIAPSAQHRITFRHDDKRHIVLVSNQITIAGLTFLALAMCGALLLVASTLFGTLAGVLTAAGGVCVFLGLWLVAPLRRRRQLESREPSESPLGPSESREPSGNGGRGETGSPSG